MPKHLRHDTRNTRVGTVSLLSHGDGEAMVHTHAIESANRDWDELKGKFCFAFSPCLVSSLYQG
jgi:hypothetical protein